MFGEPGVDEDDVVLTFEVGLNCGLGCMNDVVNIVSFAGSPNESFALLVIFLRENEQNLTANIAAAIYLNPLHKVALMERAALTKAHQPFEEPLVTLKDLQAQVEITRVRVF